MGIGEPNPYEDSVSVAHFLNMNQNGKLNDPKNVPSRLCSNRTCVMV